MSCHVFSTNGWEIFRSESLPSTMAYCEIDSFVKKFKTLCQAGRNASLTLSSNAGKAVVNLRVDLGVLGQQDDHQPHHPSQRTRNGPSKQRRRERRAAARQAAAEQAEATLSVEEKDMLKEAEKSEAKLVAEKAAAKIAEEVSENPAEEEKILNKFLTTLQ